MGLAGFTLSPQLINLDFFLNRIMTENSCAFRKEKMRNKTVSLYSETMNCSWKFIVLRSDLPKKFSTTQSENELMFLYKEKKIFSAKSYSTPFKVFLVYHLEYRPKHIRAKMALRTARCRICRFAIVIFKWNQFSAKFEINDNCSTGKRKVFNWLFFVVFFAFFLFIIF